MMKKKKKTSKFALLDLRLRDLWTSGETCGKKKWRNIWDPNYFWVICRNQTGVEYAEPSPCENS